MKVVCFLVHQPIHACSAWSNALSLSHSPQHALQGDFHMTKYQEDQTGEADGSAKVRCPCNIVLVYIPSLQVCSSACVELLCLRLYKKTGESDVGHVHACVQVEVVFRSKGMSLHVMKSGYLCRRPCKNHTRSRFAFWLAGMRKFLPQTDGEAESEPGGADPFCKS